MKKRLVVALLWLVALSPSEAQAMDFKGFASYVTSFFLFSLVHEGGHALAALSYDHKVVAFRPYPNICGDRLRPGCIMHVPPDDPDRDARTLARQNRNIAIAGTGASTLSLLALAPLGPKLGTGFFGRAFDGMLYMQARDFLIYVISDSVGYEGDWHHISETQGYPVYYLLPPAYGVYYGLNAYHNAFRRSSFKAAGGRLPVRERTVEAGRERQGGVWEVMPVYLSQWVHGAPGLGLTARVVL